MKLKMEKAKKVAPGAHTGKIIRIDYRTEPYKYTDVYVKLNDKGLEDIELKYGCPTILSENSKLGKLVKQFKEVQVGEEVELEEILIGQTVAVVTINEPSKDGTTEYAKIVQIQPWNEEPNSEQKPVEEGE